MRKLLPLSGLALVAVIVAAVLVAGSSPRARRAPKWRRLRHAPGAHVRRLAAVPDGWVFWNAALGVFMIGAAGAWLASARAPRWLGHVACLLGIALIVPFADFIALFASRLWILAVSLVLFGGERRLAYAREPQVA